MFRFLLLMSYLLLITSCSKNYNDTLTQYHEDGRAKPVVVIAPVIDSSSYEIPWSLSEEFTSLTESYLLKTGIVFIPKELKNHSHITKNPFASNIQWLQNHYDKTEFVVFLELVQHEDIPVSKNSEKIEAGDTSHDLKMCMRIRIVDLRATEPKIILQEIIHDSYYIPKTILHTDYNYIVWGSEEYTASPMHIAHNQLIKQITKRLSDYIILAKSR